MSVLFGLRAILLFILLTVGGLLGAWFFSSQSKENQNSKPVAYSTVEKEEDALPPLAIERCLEKGAIKGNIVIANYKNPYYLRGDFDGNRRPDYAVAIKGEVSKRNGVLICLDNDRAFILGGDNPKNPPFSDMPGDNFVAPNWLVYTKEESLEVRKYKDDGTAVQAASPKGDTIAMLWEDGICLIYWDGNQFRWGCGQ